ncbi:hypothetical protein FIBSPDRAFT_872021 [Athelia psychrophila]|uniref:Uncharacterized protein n=1 Tax=Athelia psychrophila TaxID=1759441 RepID=A0A165Z6L1_9AGAM|nr:hypothetical protein FIBSPDRAFT_872833 [Fibularhizoctonia sp. CBS 109695]KZP10997.1 hypothetical protein FIBSPDRAFT_872021 [Fibularhizoctonia sp. CBS 109695]
MSSDTVLINGALAGGTCVVIIARGPRSYLFIAISEMHYDHGQVSKHAHAKQCRRNQLLPIPSAYPPSDIKGGSNELNSKHV